MNSKSCRVAMLVTLLAGAVNVACCVFVLGDRNPLVSLALVVWWAVAVALGILAVTPRKRPGQ